MGDLQALCSKSICNIGGVCSRHCSALLRKQVFPLLYRPEPTFLLGWTGKVVSIGRVYRSLARDPFGSLEKLRRLAGPCGERILDRPLDCIHA